MSLQGANKFHAHLDVCAQCREHPFNLCLEGHSILMDAIQGLEGPENLVDAGENIREFVRKRTQNDESR